MTCLLYTFLFVLYGNKAFRGTSLICIKLCINRNPVVFLNDRASLPHFSLRESSVFLSEIGFTKDAKLIILHHWQTKIRHFAPKKCRAFPSQGKIREGCTIIQKYYWVSIYTKLNANQCSTPLNKRKTHPPSTRITTCEGEQWEWELSVGRMCGWGRMRMCGWWQSV